MSSCSCCDGWGKDVRGSFCPKCKSTNVGYVFGLGNLFGVMPKMKCDDCGFDAQAFPILVTTDEKLKKTVAEMKKKAKTRNSVPSKIRTKVRSSSGKKKVVRRKKK